MKIKNLWRVYTIVIAIFIVVTVLAIVVFLESASSDNNTLDNLITFVITVLSMLVAVLAYHISVKTYISIDTVNAISRMDGNVMENENYRTGILSLIRCFCGRERREAGEELILYIENLFTSSNITSGAKLADNIQNMVDTMVLFPFLMQRTADDLSDDNGNRLIVERLGRLMDKIEVEVDRLERLSEGSVILVTETVKLLKAIYAYQCYKSGQANGENVGLLMDVRGPMLKNAMSKTIYFNYVGLMYLDKAVTALKQSLGDLSIDIYSIDTYQKIRSCIKNDKIDLVVIYLKEAEKDFNRASLCIDDELMWNGFIRYNLARVQYIMYALSGYDIELWKSTMASAIEYRFRLVSVLDDILGDDRTQFFHRAFYDQYRMVKLMDARLRIATGGSCDSILAFVESINADEFGRLRHLVTDIKRHSNLKC